MLFRFWTCQVGVFKSWENAQRERLRFQQGGWDARILCKEAYIVGVGFAHTQEELTNVKRFLEEGGVATVPK